MFRPVCDWCFCVPPGACRIVQDRVLEHDDCRDGRRSLLQPLLDQREVLQLPGSGQHRHQTRQRPPLPGRDHLQHESAARLGNERFLAAAQLQTKKKTSQSVLLVYFNLD